MPTPAHYEILASGEAARHGLPVAVRSLLDNLSWSPPAGLGQCPDRHPNPRLPFLRGRVAGLIEAAELRGDLTSDERRELMLFALGAPAAKDE